MPDLINAHRRPRARRLLSTLVMSTLVMSALVMSVALASLAQAQTSDSLLVPLDEIEFVDHPQSIVRLVVDGDTVEVYVGAGGEPSAWTWYRPWGEVISTPPYIAAVPDDLHGDLASLAALPNETGGEVPDLIETWYRLLNETPPSSNPVELSAWKLRENIRSSLAPTDAPQ